MHLSRALWLVINMFADHRLRLIRWIFTGKNWAIVLAIDSFICDSIMIANNVVNTVASHRLTISERKEKNVCRCANSCTNSWIQRLSSLHSRNVIYYAYFVCLRYYNTTQTLSVNWMMKTVVRFVNRVLEFTWSCLITTGLSQSHSEGTPYRRPITVRKFYRALIFRVPP